MDLLDRITCFRSLKWKKQIITFPWWGFPGVLYLNGLLDLFNDPVLDAGLTKDVVWGDAGLTAVSVLSPGNTPTQ